jgi:hypothetical protein
MKKISFLIAGSLLFVTTLMAQEKRSLTKEYGIGLRGINSISLQYRWGTESKLHRIGAGLGGSTSFGTTDQSNSRIDTARHFNDFNNNSANTRSPFVFNFNVNYSILNLKFASEKFGYFYGPSIGLGFNYSKDNNVGSQTSGYNNVVNTSNTKSKNMYTTYRPSLGVVLGLVYKVNSNLLIYGELNPNLFYNYSYNTTHFVSGQTAITTNDSKRILNEFGFSDLSNSGAMITLVYRMNTDL